MNWTKDQQKIIDSRNGNLLVSAAAGSGKTAVLVERIIQMISDVEHPMDIDQLLVVTFTNAAAAQMREKISKAIAALLESDPKNEHYLKQMNYVNKANIVTIDSFCYQVVKEHFHVLGIDPGVRIGESGELGLLREEILEQTMEHFYEQNPDFVAFSDAFSADKNDENIKEYIRKIYDICSSYPRPEEWTKQARKALSIETEEDFHSLEIIQAYITQLRGLAEGIKEKIFMALEMARNIDGPIYMEKALLSDVVLIEDVLSAKTYSHFANLSDYKFANIGRGKKGTYDEEVAEEIKGIRNHYKEEIKEILSMFELPFEEVLNQIKEQAPMLIALLDAVDTFRMQFKKEKIAKNILEFSDVEHFALQVLCEGYDEVGEPIPSAIGKEMSEHFVEIMIDEYQDSNYLQEAILKCVSTILQGKNNMFMVGDVKQSIYRFRMARPDLFMQKYKTYSSQEGAECRKLLLKNNFRSRANVLESINYIFKQIMGADLGGIEYTKDEALVPGKDYLDIEEDNVELLLGESKGFTFFESVSIASKAESDEELDENLEDIGKMELEATMVAKRILELTGESGTVPYQIVDEETGELRDVTYKDMVILFRAPAAFTSVFYETLMAKGIPVHVQNEQGYFDTTEIRQLQSLLSVLDNPYNDVELVAVAHGYFGGFRNDDLAILALIKKKIETVMEEKYEAENQPGIQEENAKKHTYRKHIKIPLYKLLRVISQEDDVREERIIFLKQMEEEGDFITMDFISKCKHLVARIDQLKKVQASSDIYQILSYIYWQEGYYHYTECMPNGKARVRNLELFMQEAVRCSKGMYCSVFTFLRYMEQLQKKAITLGGDPGMELTENAVRIMSIHKSKGLEFPVVFLSGVGKQFNRMDIKAPIIVHSDYYIGAKYRNIQKRCGNDTFIRRAMAALMTTESIAEELRIFYVGLTRAKEKLILTGVVMDIPAYVHKYEHIAKRQEERLTFSNVHTAQNYLDLLVMSLMRNETFEHAMAQVRKRMDKKGEHVISAEYKRSYSIAEPEVRWKIMTYDYENLLVHHVKSGVEKEITRHDLLDALENSKASQEDEIMKNLSWEYPYACYANQKSKLSVTEIKRMYEVDDESIDRLGQIEKKIEQYEPKQPRFIAGKIPMNAAERGTWMHKVMEQIDFANIETKEQIKDCLACMRKEGKIPEETRSFIKEDVIYTFLSSTLGKRMVTAAKNGKLYKEKQFVIGVSPEKQSRFSQMETECLSETVSQDDTIVVQGIIDAYFEEEGQFILVDYKTDQVKNGQEEILAKRYRTQLLYYKDTFEQITGCNISKMYLYSFALGKEIEIE